MGDGHCHFLLHPTVNQLMFTVFNAETGKEVVVWTMNAVSMLQYMEENGGGYLLAANFILVRRMHHTQPNVVLLQNWKRWSSHDGRQGLE